jgi:hypothetical protein
MMAFRSLLIHTCTIQRIQLVERSGSSYGHKTRNERVITEQHLLVPCRLAMPSPSEQNMLWLSQSIRATYALYLVYTTLPAGLTPWGGWSEFQVVSVCTRGTGAVVEPGPLDIQSVENQANETHHAKLLLLRGQ